MIGHLKPKLEQENANHNLLVPLGEGFHIHDVSYSRWRGNPTCGLIRGYEEVIIDAMPMLHRMVPWAAWLSGPDQEEFCRDVVNNLRLRNETDRQESLTRLLHIWQVSAEIVHDPALSEQPCAAPGDRQPRPPTRC